VSRILVTGSADGLGRLTAESLLTSGHDVVVHARNAERAATLTPLTDRGAGLVIGDAAVGDDVRRLAAELADQAPLDVIVHNAGVWSGRAVMPVNVVAPYLLTALLPSAGRLIFLSSGLHASGRPSLSGVDWTGQQPGSYADSKLFVTALSAAVARLRPDVLSNAVDPGWVPTRMGGRGASDDLEQGHRTQEWLAVSDDPEASTSGGYWYHHARRRPHPAVADEAFQNSLLQSLADETGVPLDGAA
jgi:NAD(P)-dependent dehydrogenase (short-subunit alcohol dehydrogenase family)